MKLSSHRSGASADSKKKGGHRGWNSSSIVSSTSSSVVQVCTLHNFLDQWKIISSNRFLLNIVKGHYLQLKCHHSLSIIINCNIDAFAAHHPLIRKEVDNLLAKDTTKPSTGGAGFYSNVFVVPKCTGSSHHMLNTR